MAVQRLEETAAGPLLLVSFPLSRYAKHVSFPLSLSLSLSPSLELSFFSPLLPFSSSTFAFSFFADVHYARIPASRERPRFIQLVNEFKFDATRG